MSASKGANHVARVPESGWPCYCERGHKELGRKGRREGGERSATTESGAASGQRMPFPDYVSAQGPVPTPWTQVDPVGFSRLRRAAPGELQRPCGCAWSNSDRMVGDCLTTLPLG